MACPEFEDLVREGAGGHAARCEECRALLDALADVDAALEAAFAGVSAPPGMAAIVRARAFRELPLRGPSALPEILDFIGWAAVLALAVVLLPRFLPLIDAALAGLG
jgi:predicted anti-sigma-YlaC factor YlaD